ncbi:aminotransferase class IV [Inquilinus sp. Marseille-Q2685]|uniref:aminotransferase class IV n=1 Tax=Inquilinus sp. Marseille-Q2685 TaxID=2866581 RepID=UPI001CE415EA|nr:aminotransferase class IV [Inquilinus sp. Marseille-Q2685]
MPWLNGRLLAAGEAWIDPADRGFTLGDGLFETIRVKDGAAVWLDRHLRRLAEGRAVLGIPARFGDAALAEACAAVIAAEGIEAGALRLTVSRGVGPRGVLPPAAPVATVLVAGHAGLPPQGPVALVVARGTCRNQASPLSRIKSLNYLDAVLARREAAERGADDAVMLNTAGRVAETTIANLFARIDGAWATPPVAEGGLPGIMRAEVLARLGAAERPLDVEDLQRAEALLLTNALSIRAVARLEGAALPEDEDTAVRLRRELGLPA